MKYAMTCSCGDEMSVDASSREEAIDKMKEMMTAESIEKHWEEKHKGEQPMPTVEEEHEMIEKTLREEEAPSAMA